MKLFIGLVAMGLFAESVSSPGPTTKISLNVGDANEILKVQIEQYKAFTAIQKLQADLKMQSDQLNELNAKAATKLKDMQAKYKCEGCQLGDDMQFTKVEKQVAQK